MSAATPTVYIPTLEGGERLAACLGALEGQTVESEIVVADNGPGNGCSELLAAQFPRVKRIAFGGRNLGFGTALNRAVMAEGEGPVIFLNDDAVAEPGFVENLVSAREESGEAMIAGVLLKASDPSRVDSAGIRCDRTLTAWDYMTGEPADRLAGAPDPFGPTGGAALFDREAFVRAGGFDERIFLYYEDLDLALRMRMAGHRCLLAASARAVHESSATLGRRAAAKYRQTGFSRGYLLRKYGVMRSPTLAAKTVLSDGSACLAQMVLDRTLAGAAGRTRGWLTGRGTNQLVPPTEQLEPASVTSHIQVRLQRRLY